MDLEGYRVIAQLESRDGRVFSTRWVAGDQILDSGNVQCPAVVDTGDAACPT